MYVIRIAQLDSTEVIQSTMRENAMSIACLYLAKTLRLNLAEYESFANPLDQDYVRELNCLLTTANHLSDFPTTNDFTAFIEVLNQFYISGEDSFDMSVSFLL